MHGVSRRRGSGVSIFGGERGGDEPEGFLLCVQRLLRPQLVWVCSIIVHKKHRAGRRSIDRSCIRVRRVYFPRALEPGLQRLPGYRAQRHTRQAVTAALGRRGRGLEAGREAGGSVGERLLFSFCFFFIPFFARRGRGRALSFLDAATVKHIIGSAKRGRSWLVSASLSMEWPMHRLELAPS